MPDAERFPAYGGMIASEAGDVWIGPYEPGQLLLGIAYMGRPTVPEGEWLVFGPDGAIRATVRTPEAFRPVSAAGNRLWGVHTDSLEVESVRAYEIERE